MIEKLLECRDIIYEICCDVEGRYPFGCVRVGRLLEEMIEELGESEWDWDDVISLPVTLPIRGDEQPFPAA